MDILKIIGLRTDDEDDMVPSDIDLEIQEVTERLRQTDSLSAEYPKLSENLEELYKIKAQKLETDPAPEPGFFEKYGEVLIKGGFTILSTFMVLHYEDVIGPIHSTLKNKLGRD